MALNFAAVCVNRDSQFLSDLKEGTASVVVFSAHLDDEVTVDLADAEAGQVRLMAADTALDIARKENQLLSDENFIVRDEALKKWCDRPARHFILEIMRMHSEKHDEFDRRLRAAKQ